MGIGDVWRGWYLEWIVGYLGLVTTFPLGIAFSPNKNVLSLSTKQCCGVFFTKNENKHGVSLVTNTQTDINTRGCVA